MPETPSTQAFVASATITVNAKMGDVWAVWADVNAWTNWDDGIESVKLHGNFKTGTEITLTPLGAEPVTVVLTTVSQGEGFSDEAVLPFGTIRNHHAMAPAGDLVTITHEVRAEIGGEAATMFGAKIWPGMQEGVGQSLRNLADLVGND